MIAMVAHPVYHYTLRSFSDPTFSDPASAEKACRQSVADMGLDESSWTYISLMKNCDDIEVNDANNAQTTPFDWGSWALRAVICLAIALFTHHRVNRRNSQIHIEDTLTRARNEGRYRNER